MTPLYVIGIGPGDHAHLTMEAEAAIAAVTDVVGYGLYMDLLGDAMTGKRRHQRELGEETDRARMALDLAASGKPTALISSGDIGIFAMATLVFELLDHANQGLENGRGWDRVDIQVMPGISAMQLASARLGAILGHDFCAISLSDLLTDWEVIDQRLNAAAKGDFVTAFYNPVSKRRDWQLNHARTVYLEHRPPETPVIVARNLGRDDERVEVIALAELEASRVDMLTVVVIGSSTTRHIRFGRNEWVYTPRGYAKKRVES
ncbi:precorrin-3B C(17)-methyltransferase [Larsenimonas suaedae]|uniref:Precorrin-3B C(17)-methyltransferase n=1 Tax=Larsenimonas suaedae TaxID=1851019 RepID=A0ABU1GZE6_9GAMM|nr:precorrin-3B C(17)-methyltransferase [Larsenimonas suaedae]MCM2971546.1 precorrin-3B C(17)-methyltransferase [Larsenimonas suaedae]MDR5896802.1 precorrin-3B C(17)-methyltransferase [Larsenimonas suaedae]